MLTPRKLFNQEHEIFRVSIRRFFEEEATPFHDEWEEQGYVNRQLWTTAGRLGLLCLTIPRQYGGCDKDPLYSMIMIEEQAYAGTTGILFSTHSDVIANYILNFGTEEQKVFYLPKMASGELVGCLAITEPQCGSDIQAIQTTAHKSGDFYIINGSKTFISGGNLCDFIVLVVKTVNDNAKEISILIVEANSPGITKGKPLRKMGLKAQDTCEIFFDNVKVPRTSLLGVDEGKGFNILMRQLAFERLTFAVNSIATAKKALQSTIQFMKSRKTLGISGTSFQSSRFKLAEIKSEIDIGQVYVDRCFELHLKNQLPDESAAAAKYWSSEMLCKIVDECVQLHGGYGYIQENPLARTYLDVRASRIYAGTGEIMKEIIARSL